MLRASSSYAGLHSAKGGAVETGCSDLLCCYILVSYIILPLSTAPPYNEYPAGLRSVVPIAAGAFCAVLCACDVHVISFAHYTYIYIYIYYIHTLHIYYLSLYIYIYIIHISIILCDMHIYMYICIFTYTHNHIP